MKISSFTFFSSFKLGWICLALIGSLTSALTQVDVVKSKVYVDVLPLTGSQGEQATAVLKADLHRTMLIEVRSKSPGAFTVKGEANSSGIHGILLDASGKEILNQRYYAPWRKAVHQLADAITQATTGVEGFATSRLAFIASDSGHKELYIMDIDGENLQRLTNDQSISNGPTWSHDANQIAYTSYKKGYPDVYIIDLKTGQRRRVAYFPGINTGPSFSPDDSLLALTLSKDGNPEIYIMPAQGGEPRRLTRTRGTETSPSWSPDGQRLVYSSDDRGSPQLFLIPQVGSGDPERLFTNSNFSTEPNWSPDGKKITYTFRIGGQPQIGVYSLQDGQSHAVTKKGGEDSSWTRNSRHMIYVNKGRLYLLDSVTHHSMPLRVALKKISEPAITH